MLDKDLVKKLNSFNVEKLARSDELGVHYNFAQSVPTFKNLFTYLKEIADSAGSLLTPREEEEVNNSIRKLLELGDRVRGFNPKEHDASLHQSLLNEIESAWQSAARSLRPIHNFLKIRTLDANQLIPKTEEVLKKVDAVQGQIDHQLRTLNNLPTETENQYNKSFKELQDRFTQQAQTTREQLDSIRADISNNLNELKSQTENSTNKAEGRIENLLQEANEKIETVLLQARRFSAKEALVTYAQIFKDEAETVNKPAIRLWTIALGLLILTEVAVALSLFFFFLPEVLSIGNNYGENAVGLGLIGSALFVKIFILSVIAVGISFAVRSLKAQNHLYASNKFKGNALASFQAFLDATDNTEVIDKIIEKVSVAVYTQSTSGYLTKDETSARVIDKDSSGLISRLLG